jgi:CO dehydrogenase maturation factor
MCRAHAQVRHLLGSLLDDQGPVTIVDMEAGLEHLSRGTGSHVHTLCVMLEPYFKALETARRCAELARELKIPRVLGVANKIRDAGDLAAVQEFARAHRLPVAATIPWDDEIRRGELAGRAPIDAPGSPAVRAIETLADRVMDTGGWEV